MQAIEVLIPHFHIGWPSLKALIHKKRFPNCFASSTMAVRPVMSRRPKRSNFMMKLLLFGCRSRCPRSQEKVGGGHFMKQGETMGKDG